MRLSSKVPTRVRLYGNKDLAARYVAYGHKQLSKLVEGLRFRNIPTGVASHKMDDGTIIKLGVINGITTIDIISLSLLDDKAPLEQRCECGVYFSEGFVTAVNHVDEYIEPAGNLYTVDVCQSNNTQITVENCTANDFAVYAVGDRVWCCLSIRELVPAVVYGTLALPAFGYAQPWGGAGLARGYSIFLDDGGSRYYTELDSAAKDAGGQSMALPDEDWPATRPVMCSLRNRITTSPYWLPLDNIGYSSYVRKAYKTMETKYSLQDRSGITPDIMYDGSGNVISPDSAPRYEFNLQILPFDL